MQRSTPALYTCCSSPGRTIVVSLTSLSLAAVAFAAALQQPVVGGTPVTSVSWPDAVAIYNTFDRFSCTGTLIAPRVVLTAGHCGIVPQYVLTDTNDHATGGTRYDVADAHVFDDYLDTFDVAVLVLAEPVENVQPRPLLLDCLADTYVVSESPVHIVGFGATSPAGADDNTRLHEASTSIVDPVCADLDAGCQRSVSPGGELIAGGDGIDSCTGDSGGPLYLATAHGTYLAAVTSRAAVGGTSPCGSGGIYVRADAIAGWIQEVANVDLARPDCEASEGDTGCAFGPTHASSGLMAALALLWRRRRLKETV